ASLAAFRALQPILDDLDPAAAGCARLAEAHRATVMAGRTLGQQALPTTFGIKAAGWLTALEEAAAGLDRVRRTRLGAPPGGAARGPAPPGPGGGGGARGARLPGGGGGGPRRVPPDPAGRPAGRGRRDPGLARPGRGRGRPGVCA